MANLELVFEAENAEEREFLERGIVRLQDSYTITGQGKIIVKKDQMLERAHPPKDNGIYIYASNGATLESLLYEGGKGGRVVLDVLNIDGLGHNAFALGEFYFRIKHNP